MAAAGLLVNSSGLATAARRYFSSVIYGVADGSWPTSYQTLNSTFLNGTNGFELDGVAANNYTASGIATGDVNGDGYADILIGAVGASFGQAYGGAAYVVFGGPNVSGAPSTKGGASWASLTPALLNSTLLNGTNGAEFDNATSRHNYIGSSVAAGDFNGDGIADLVIGGSGGPGGNGPGSVYIVWGKTGAWLEHCPGD